VISEQTRAAEVTDRLEQDGIAVLPDFVQGETLGAMQRAFESRLERMRWNNFDGYERTERYRLNVQDILTLEQGFVSTAIHPVVKEVLRAYLGDSYQLVEAKGWRSVATRRVFHGWHGDSWYDKTKVSGIPREVKLGLYLTDVKTGAFRYLRGSHRQHQTRDWKNHEIENFNQENISVVTGTAGTAFLFDTSGIHGQSWPILEPRHAVFYNYHDPSIPLQEEDITGGRYHPLMLNAAFLGGLTEEDRFILGFGNKTHFHPDFRRRVRHEALQRWQDSVLKKKIVADETAQRIAARFRRMIG
jgi:hypothetical protein